MFNYNSATSTSKWDSLFMSFVGTAQYNEKGKKYFTETLRMFLIYFPCYFCSLVAIFIQVFLPAACISHYEGMVGMNYRSVAACVVRVSETEAVWKPTVALAMLENITENKVAFYDELYKKLNSRNRPFITMDTINNETLDVSQANYMVVTYLNDCEDSKSFNFKNLTDDIKYLIMVETHTDCSSYLKGFGDSVAKYDVSFFVKYPADNWDLYTYIPDIDHETCEVVIDKPIKINTCRKGKLAHSLAFPSKVTTNYQKCPFKVGFGALFPFGMIENRTTLKNYDRLDVNTVSGMDFEIIKIISDRFNATLNLYYILKQEENPYVNIDYLPLLINGSLEACVGGLYRIYGDVVEYSGVYASQQVMWIYTAQRENKTWENMAVTIDGLYLFLVFYLIYSVVWCLICAFDKKLVSFKTTLLYSWGALLGTSSLQDANSFKQKVLNVVYLNMCLHLSVYISIQLYSFFTIHGPPDMLKTNEDIMNSGRTPYLKSLTKYFVNDEKYVQFANTSSECDGFQDCAEVSLLRRGVTVFISSYFYPFQAASAVNDEARMLRSVENLLTVYHEMIIRKESPLVKKFKKTSVRIFEAGITEKLVKEAIGLNVVAKAKIAAQNMMTSSYACQSGCKLNLHQFNGVFYVWGIGCALSVCLFILEIIMQKPSQK